MTPSPAMLRELADRVEAAAGPDRELDCAVWRIVDPSNASFCLDNGNRPLPWLHRYTDSLDAAMTLVPEGWKGVIDLTIEPNRAELYPPDYDQNDWTLKETARGDAATPALSPKGVHHD